MRLIRGVESCPGIAGKDQAMAQFEGRTQFRVERCCPRCGRTYYATTNLHAQAGSQRGVEKALNESAAKLNDHRRNSFGHFCPHCERFSPRGLKILFPEGIRKGLIRLHKKRLKTWRYTIPSFFVLIGALVVGMVLLVHSGLLEQYLTWVNGTPFISDGSLETTEAKKASFFISLAGLLITLSSAVPCLYGYVVLKDNAATLLDALSNEDIEELLSLIHRHNTYPWYSFVGPDISYPDEFSRWTAFV